MTQAVRLAQSLFKQGRSGTGAAHRAIDGFLVKGVRSGENGVAVVLDPAAQLLILGQYSDEHVPSDYFEGSLIAQLPLGRDSYYPDGVKEVIDIPAGQVVTAGRFGRFTLGDPNETSHLIYAPSGEIARGVNGVGATRCFTANYYPGDYKVSGMAFAPRSVGCCYFLPTLAATFYRRIFSAPAWAPVEIPESPTAPQAALSLRVSDSLMSGFGGMAFCKRLSPPAYTSSPGAADILFNNCQAPWADFSKPDWKTDENGAPLFTTTLVASTVFAMQSDSDRFGVRGLWVLSIEIRGGVPALLHQYVVDPRNDPIPEMVPHTLPGESTSANYRLRAGVSRLDSGAIVSMDGYLVTQGNGSPGSHYSLTARVLTATGLGSIPIISAGPLYAEGDLACPIGCATDGKIVVAPVFSSIRNTDGNAFTPPRLDVLVITETGATNAFSAEIGIYPCLGGVDDAVYSTGSAQANSVSLWGPYGAGGNRVCYIGNHKFIFYISTIAEIGTPPVGNIACAIYDAQQNTVTLGGEIESRENVLSSFVDIGAFECVRLETRAEKGFQATIIATRGGNSQFDGSGDLSDGSTYISYDSGATWLKFLEVGSPSGALHGGNILSPRSEPPLKV